MKDKAAPPAAPGDARARQRIWSAALYWARHIGQGIRPKAQPKRKKGQLKG